MEQQLLTLQKRIFNILEKETEILGFTRGLHRAGKVKVKYI